MPRRSPVNGWSPLNHHNELIRKKRWFLCSELLSGPAKEMYDGLPNVELMSVNRTAILKTRCCIIVDQFCKGMLINEPKPSKSTLMMHISTMAQE